MSLPVNLTDMKPIAQPEPRRTHWRLLWGYTRLEGSRTYKWYEWPERYATKAEAHRDQSRVARAIVKQHRLPWQQGLHAGQFVNVECCLGESPLQLARDKGVVK